MTMRCETSQTIIALSTGAVSFGADALEIANAKHREAANHAAIELAQRLEVEGRFPTLEERQGLLSYSGLGGTQLNPTPSEGNTLGLLIEYYTPLPVARAIWELL